MATKKKEKRTTEYVVDMVNNGIVLSVPFSDYIECEKYNSGEGASKYQDVCNFLGKLLWDDVDCASQDLSSTRVKVTITIEAR